MSTTTTKRSHADALADAMHFRALFPAACYTRWEFAGSLRRNRPEVSDVEHVVTPAFGEVRASDGLFATTRAGVNLIGHRLDQLVTEGVVTKHVYGESRTNRWGDLYRGADFNGFNHEVFMADADNFGAILAIRTGPADYSQQLVTRLKAGGMYRQSGGYVMHVKSGERVPARDERAYFTLCRLSYVEPEKRI